MESAVSSANMGGCIGAYILVLMTSSLFVYLNYWFYTIYMVDWIFMSPPLKHSYYLFSGTLQAAMIWLFWQEWIKIKGLCPSGGNAATDPLQ